VPKPVVPVLAGLLVGVLFLTANIAALHDPQPHDAPVAVPYATGGYQIVTAARPIEAIRRREIYAAVQGDQLLYAGANGMTAGQQLSQQLGQNLTPVDVVPLQRGDPNGMSLQQIVLGTIMGGFLMGVLTAQLVLGDELYKRGLAFLGFAVAFGLLAAVVIDPLLGVLTGHFALVWLWVGVTAFTIAVSVGALARSAGQLGLPIALIAFLILGNPSAGATAPADFLPWLFRTVGPYLPPNAMASGLIGTTYFDADVLRPVLVLLAWAATAVIALVAFDRVRGRRQPLAYDVAAAADDPSG
jgi:hypothetical protein